MSELNLLRERHGLNLPDSQLQKIVETCSEIIVAQDHKDHESEIRKAFDEHGGCSVCGDLDGYTCVCSDEDEDEEVAGYECMSCGYINTSDRAGGELFSCGRCSGPTKEIYF